MAKHLGYSLHGADNGADFYERGAVGACSACGLVEDLEWVNPKLRLRRRRFDYSSTYDGVSIVSESFRSFTSSFSGIRFVPLPNDPDFFVVHADPVVEVDAEQRGIRFELRCEECGRWQMIAGDSPIVLFPGERLPQGFSRTDHVLGSASLTNTPAPRVQSPTLLVSETIGEQLREQNFSGLDLDPVIDDFQQFRKDRGLV